jgi:hypothetical protein
MGFWSSVGDVAKSVGNEISSTGNFLKNLIYNWEL